MRRHGPHLPLAILAAAFVAAASLSFARAHVFLEHVEVFSSSQSRTYALAALAMLAGYGLLVLILYRGAVVSKRAWYAWGAFFLALCLVTPPFLSRDAAAYVIAGKEALAGVNPYLTPLAAFDAAWTRELGQIWWLGFPSMYGPLFVLLAALAMLAPAHGLLAAVFAYKILNAGLFLVSVAVLAKVAARLKAPAWIVPAYAFNPAVLIHVVLEGHNDVFVIVGVLGALYLGLKGSRRSGAALLGAAVASKFYPILLLPMLVLDRARFREKAERLAAAVAVVLASAAPFGFPFLAIMDGLRAQASLHCLYACSPFVTAFDRVFGMDASAARLFAALVLYAAIAWRFLIVPRDAGASRVAYVFWTLGAFFFVQIRWLAPWYLVVLLPFGLLLSGRRAYLALTLLLTAFSLLQYA